MDPPRKGQQRLGHQAVSMRNARSHSGCNDAFVPQAMTSPHLKTHATHATHAILSLAFEPGRQWVGQGINHMQLLSHPAVAAQLLRWLG